MIPDNLSVIVVVVLGDEDVVLLQQRSKVLADQSPHIQEGHHYQRNPDKAEGGLLPVVTHPTIETTKLVHVKQPEGTPLLSRVRYFTTVLSLHSSSALTFLGLGRMAPEDVLTTVLPRKVEGHRGEARADSLTKRPSRADAMSTAVGTAAMR